MMMSGAAAVGTFVVAPAMAQSANDAALIANNHTAQSPEADIAQEANGSTSAPSANQSSTQDIIVTGIRASIASSINTKRNLDVIADVVSAEAIGKLPDTNVAEALQRITGVQITREAGEGKYVSVRGLPPDFNVITLNGSYLANASGDLVSQGSDRRFDFSILPPDFIQSLEVYKSSRADLDEGGVSSTINIRTLQPLDLGRRVLTVSAQGQYEQIADKFAPKVSAAYSDTFADGRLGIAIGGVFDRRRYSAPSTSTGELVPFTPSAAQIPTGSNLVAGKQYLVIDSITRAVTQEERTRKTVNFTLQAEPVDHLRLTLNGIYAHFDGDGAGAVVVDRARFSPMFIGAPLTVGKADANGVITDFQTPDDALQITTSNTRTRETVKGLDGDITWDDGTNMARLKGAYSEASYAYDNIGLDGFVWSLVGGNTVAGGYSIDPNDPVGRIVLPTGFPALSRFADSAIPDYLLTRSEKAFSVQEDFSHRFGDGFFHAIRFGVKVSDRRRSNDTMTYLDLRLSRMPQAQQNLGQYVTGTLDSGFSAYGGPNLNFTDIPRIDPQIYLNQCCNGSIDDFRRQVLADKTGALFTAPNPSTDYRIRETTQAGYAMLDFGAADRALSGSVGVRVVNTDQKVSGASIDLSTIRPSLSPTVPPVIPASVPLEVHRSYLDVLPSFNVTWKPFGPDLLVRGAVGRQVTRPNLDFLVPRATIDTTRTPFLINSGNPDLAPYRSWNYDLSVEYYPKKDTLLSLALFHKDISGYIYNGSQTFAAGQYVFTRSLPVNGVPARLNGVEANVSTILDFLPAPLDGLGVQANVTYADGHIAADPANQLPERSFEGLSKWTYNLVLFYEKSGFSIRAAYNARSAYLSAADLRGTHIAQVTTKAFNTLDGQIGYQLTRNVSLFGQAINLLNEANVDVIQPFKGGSYPLNYSESGRRFIAGARMTF